LPALQIGPAIGEKLAARVRRSVIGRIACHRTRHADRILCAICRRSPKRMSIGFSGFGNRLHCPEARARKKSSMRLVARIRVPWWLSDFIMVRLLTGDTNR